MKKIVLALSIVALLVAPTLGAELVVGSDTLHVYVVESDPRPQIHEQAIYIFSEPVTRSDSLDTELPLRVTVSGDLSKVYGASHSATFIGRLTLSAVYAVTDSLVEHSDYIEQIAVRDTVQSTTSIFQFPVDGNASWRTVKIPGENVELTRAKLKAFLTRALPRIAEEKVVNKPMRFKGKVVQSKVAR